jgi:hypothetical protein
VAPARCGVGFLQLGVDPGSRPAAPEFEDRADQEEYAAKLRSLLIGLAVLGTVAGVASPQGKLDCGKAYKDIWERLDRERFAKISPEQLAGVNRMALRAFDACQAGDEADARELFARLDRLAK